MAQSGLYSLETLMPYLISISYSFPLNFSYYILDHNETIHKNYGYKL